MVHGVACGSVDDGAVGDVFTVVDHDGPEIDEHKENDIGPFLQREDEWENMVGNTLRPAIDGVEGMGRIGSGHDPFVVRLMQSLVNKRVVKTTVNPVDAEICEEQEKRELQDAVIGEGLLGEGVVHFAVAADFGQEEWGRENGHDRHGFHGLRNFHANLVAEIFGVFECGFVEDENI